MASPRRFRQLIDQWDLVMRRAFEQAIRNVKDAVHLEQVARMLADNDIDGALRAVGLDPISFRPLDKAFADAFEAGGGATSGGLPVIQGPDGFRVKFQFNVRNPTAERWLSNYSSSLVRDIVEDQRKMISEHLRSGLALGNNPRTSALDLVGRVGADGRRSGGVIGLTRSQAEWVRNYEAELRSDTPRDALQRSLRDARFDAAVERAAAADEPIPSALVDKMVTAYENRALRFRAEAIARTETMTALHEGQSQAMDQAVASGAIKRDQVSFVWRATADERTRDSHAEMDGQVRAMGEMFVTGDGNELEFPGDPNGEPSEVINCRCWREPQVDFLAGLT